MFAKSITIDWLQSFLLSAGVIYGFTSVSVTYFDVEQHGQPFDVSTLNTPVTEAKASIGERIIREAFNSSYYDLVDFCRLDNKLDFTECVEHASRMGSRVGGTYSEKWPWWFRTLLRDAADPSTQVQGPWHVLQYSKPKIQQCISEKSGTKVWRQLHCEAMEDKEAKAQALNLKRNITSFTCSKLQGSLQPGSDRIVFLRDPLDRFLSGFLDKCTGSKLHLQPHCEPLILFQNNITTPIDDLRTDDKKLFEIYVDTFPLRWNLHFIPQSLYCDGLFRHIHNYNFVGSMDLHFQADLRRLREVYPELSTRIKKVFNVSDGIIAENYGVETKAASQTEKFYSPHTVRRVLEYYAIDYVMLDIPIPAWAQNMLSNDPVIS